VKRRRRRSSEGAWGIGRREVIGGGVLLGAGVCGGVVYVVGLGVACPAGKLLSCRDEGGASRKGPTIHWPSKRRCGQG